MNINNLKHKLMKSNGFGTRSEGCENNPGFSAIVASHYILWLTYEYLDIMLLADPFLIISVKNILLFLLS